MAMTQVYDRERLKTLCDGERTYKEIADILGWKKRTVQRIALEENYPRRGMGMRKADRTGKNNPAFVCGRRIDHDGYAIVTAPLNHPNARLRSGRKYGVMFEHRLMIEDVLNRYLTTDEVVDHIDGLTLHNDVDNLRVFDKNSSHLKETLSSHYPVWSEAGIVRMKQPHHLRKDCERIDTHQLRVKRGDVRLRAILRCALQFGIDSPYLLGSHRHLQNKQIDFSSHASLELAYQRLLSRYEQDLV